MKRFLLVSTVMVGAFTLQPQPAHAQISVACVNCSDYMTQLLQYAKEAASLQTQLQQYATMIQNTIALPQEIWAAVQGDLMQVRSIVNAASILSGNSGSMIGRLQSAAGYANTVTMLPQQIASQITTWQQTAGNSLNNFGRVLGLQQTQQASDAALLAALQAHAASAVGQMQAIQAGNELAGQTAAELLKIHEAILSQGQMVAQQYTLENDRRAMEDAALSKFLSSPNLPVTGGTRF